MKCYMYGRICFVVGYTYALLPFFVFCTDFRTFFLFQKEENYDTSISVEPTVYKSIGQARIRKLPTPQIPIRSHNTAAKNEMSQNVIGNHGMMDYPIRGTISPLSGDVNQQAFVFGRPMSPDLDVQRCKSPPDNRPSETSRRNVYGKPPKYVPPASRNAKPGLYTRNAGICDQCNNCLLDLKRQAVRLMNVEKSSSNKVTTVFIFHRSKSLT